MALTTHPNRDELRAYLLGMLPAETSDSIASHLDDCPDCETTVAALDHETDPLVSQLAIPSQPGEFADESELQRALSFVKQIGREVSSPAAARVAPQPLGRLREYELLEKLGEGGMGAVYKARHTRLDKIVALKVLPRYRMHSPDAVARFDREMRAVGKLDHPHLIRAHDAGEVDGTHFLVMEYVAGSDLAALVKQQGPLTIADACELVRQAAEGLQYAQDHGLVHRDIKPSNLMLAMNGETQTASVKILDLGLALLADQPSAAGGELTSTGQVMGTLDYMAPEQGGDSHQVDIRADIYSLGATLYKLLSGEAPFAGAKYATPVQKLTALAMETPLPLVARRADVPAEVSSLVERMLAKSPADRPSTPAQVATALLPYAKGSNLWRLTHDGSRTTSPVEPDTGSHLSNPSTGTDPSGPPVEAAAAVPSRSVPSTASYPRPGAASDRPRRPRWIAIAAACGGFLVLLAAAFVLRLTTDKGDLIITSNDPGIRVAIKQSGRTVKELELDQGENRVRIYSGQYEVELAGPFSGITVKHGHVTLERGKEARIEIVQEAPANVARVEPKPSVEPKPTDTPSTSGVPEGFVPKPIIVGKPLPKPTPVELNLAADPIVVQPGAPLSGTALVPRPMAIPDVLSWTIELRQSRGSVCVKYSPDGRWFATGAGDGVVRIWDTASMQIVKVFVPPVASSDKYAESLSWSPDGRYLAVGQRSMLSVTIWDVSSGALLQNLGPTFNSINALAWSPDGKYLAFAGAAERGLVVMWDMVTGQVAKRLKAHTDHLWSLAWSPDGKYLASGGDDKTVLIWDLSVDQPVHKLSSLSGRMTGLAWSPDGTVLATQGYYSSAPTRLFDTQTWELLDVVPHTNYAAGRLTWSPDGTQLYIVGAGIWDIRSRRMEIPLESPEYSSGDWSPDGKQVLSGVTGGQLSRRALLSPAPQSTSRQQYFNQVVWSPAGTEIAARGHANGVYRAFVFNTGPGKLLNPFNPGDGAIAWSPSGETLAVVKGKVNLWDLKQGTQSTPLKAPKPQSIEAAWHPDRNRLATIDADNKVRIWDLETGEVVKTLETEIKLDANLRLSLAFSPDGRYLAADVSSASKRVTPVVVWDVDTAAVVQSVSLDIYGSAVGWFPNSRQLAVGNIALDIETGTRQILPSDFSAWSRQGTILGGGDTPKLFKPGSTEAKLLLHNIEGHWNDASFAPDSTRVAIGDSGGFIWIFDVATQEPQAVMTLLPDGRPLAIGADGHYRADEDVSDAIVYVVQTAEGQQTYTPQEFEQKFNWKNDPTKVKLGE